MEEKRVGCMDCDYRGFLFQSPNENYTEIRVERCDTCSTMSDEDAGTLAREYLDRLETQNDELLKEAARQKQDTGRVPKARPVSCRRFKTDSEYDAYADLMGRVVSAAEMGVEVGFCPVDKDHLVFDAGYLSSKTGEPVRRHSNGLQFISIPGANIWLLGSGTESTRISKPVELFDERWA